MAGTLIEWADMVWNPITGCSPVSEGCANCYARRMANRLAGRYGYLAKDPFQVTFHPEKLKEPTTWRKPRRIFVCSMADLFHDDVRDEWIAAMMLVASICSHHTFMILTKRPERMKRWFEENPFGYTQGAALAEFCNYLPMASPGGRRDRVNGDGTINGNGKNEWPLPNVWLGVTAENQQRADERISILLQIPAAVRFVSIEPMLGIMNLDPWLWEQVEPMPQHFDVIPRRNGISWVICGGETGPGARPMHPDWVRSLSDQCQPAGVPFFFKGWGDWAPSFNYYEDEDQDARDVALDMPHSLLTVGGYRWEICHDGQPPISTVIMHKIGKKNAGRKLDGREWNEFPG